MTKRCPIMSKQNESQSKIYCFENECAFWDEEMKMCCIKSAMIAVAGNKDGGSSSTAQAYYIPPSSYCCASSNEKSYVLDFDEGGYKQ